MNRETQKLVKQAKEQAALLVRYANPKSRNKPTEEEVLAVLIRHIPYCGTRPAITKFSVSSFNRNRIIKSAYFVVELDNGKSYQISAYENLTGRTPEQREEDKTAEFPSGLFTIFHDEIKAPATEPEQAEIETPAKEPVKVETVKHNYELKPTDGRKSFYNKARVTVDTDGTETLYSYDTPIIKRTPTGEYIRLWDGWTATTGRHIKAFCGMGKAQFTALPFEEQDTPTDTGGRVLTNAESYAAMIGRRRAG